MAKKRITTYTFDASENTITFSGAMEIEGFLLITNVVDNIIIYNFADPLLGGSIVSNVLTLTYDTSSMSDTDELMILYDDGVETVAVTQSGTWDEVGINDSGNSITVDGSVTADTGLDQPLTDTQLRATAVPVSGTVTANLSTTDNTVLDAIETATEAIQAGQLPDGHNVTIDNASIPVTGTFWQATQPVSGTVTANLGAVDNAVLDDIASDTEAIKTSLATAGGLAVNLGANNDVTVTSGSVTANAGTNLNTSALALETGGNLASIKTNTDKIPALGQALAAGSVPVVLPAAQITTLTPPAAITGYATSAKQDTLIGHVDGIEGSVDGIETLLTTIEGNQLPDGHNVTVDNASLAVTGTFWQATQPVSGTVTANLSATDNAVLDTIDAVLDTIKTDTGNITTAVQLIDNAIGGSEMQVDVVGALPAGSAIIGKVGHDVTGIGHGVKVVTTAGTHVALASSTTCKKVDIQAQTDNTGLIAVGGSEVDATIATGTGIILEAGDVYSIEIDNLADIYIDSTVSGEGVRFTYFT